MMTAAKVAMVMATAEAVATLLAKAMAMLGIVNTGDGGVELQ